MIRAETHPFTDEVWVAISREDARALWTEIQARSHGRQTTALVEILQRLMVGAGPMPMQEVRD